MVLAGLLKRMAYRPQAKRRSYIPKPGSQKGRPLGISCFEDKIVELVVKWCWNPSTRPYLRTAAMGTAFDATNIHA